MSKTEILEELPKLTKIERQEIRLRLAELDSEDWLDDDEPLTTKKRYSTRAWPPTPTILMLVAHGNKLRAESEPGLADGRTDKPSSNRIPKYLQTRRSTLLLLAAAS